MMLVSRMIRATGILFTERIDVTACMGLPQEEDPRNQSRPKQMSIAKWKIRHSAGSPSIAVENIHNFACSLLCFDIQKCE